MEHASLQDGTKTMVCSVGPRRDKDTQSPQVTLIEFSWNPQYLLSGHN